MEVQSAIRLINGLIYKPEWKITATDHTNRFESSVKVRIDYPAYSSDRDEAVSGYPTKIYTYSTFPLIVADCDDVDLYRQIITAIVEIETHEAREFLRVRRTWWAPFHPHRIDGMKRWGNVTGDLKFGIC